MSESALLSDAHRSSASARRSWTKLRDKIKEKDKGSYELFAEFKTFSLQFSTKYLQKYFQNSPKLI